MRQFSTEMFYGVVLFFLFFDSLFYLKMPCTFDTERYYTNHLPFSQCMLKYSEKAECDIKMRCSD